MEEVEMLGVHWKESVIISSRNIQNKKRVIFGWHAGMWFLGMVPVFQRES